MNERRTTVHIMVDLEVNEANVVDNRVLAELSKGARRACAAREVAKRVCGATCWRDGVRLSYVCVGCKDPSAIPESIEPALHHIAISTRLVNGSLKLK